METKICNKCGRELPITEFMHNHLSKDGYMSTCKACVAIKHRRTKARKNENSTPPHEGGNPELAKFTPRELMAELKARNYVGKLYYTKEIDLAKL